MPKSFLYFPKDVDYSSLLEEYLENPDKEFGKLYDQIIYTKMTSSFINKDSLILVTTLNKSSSEITKNSVSIKLKNIFDANNTKNTKNICSIISENTKLNLTNLSFKVNGRNDPGIIYDQCHDTHSKIYLTKKIFNASPEEIMYLLDEEEYKSYCTSRDSNTCETIKPWMKGDITEDPIPICQLIKGTLSNSCQVDEKNKNKIMAGIRKRINKCIANMGCVTDTYGNNPSQKKFMRRHTKDNFPNDKHVSQICCKRSLKASVKGALRMERLYKILDMMPIGEQMNLVNKSNLSSTEKQALVISIKEQDKVGENKIKSLVLDSTTENLLNTFSIILKESLQKEMYELMNLKNTPSNINEKKAKEKLKDLGGENSSIILDMINKTAKSIINLLKSAGTILWEVVKYFTSKGFDIIKWMFNHPSTAMWMTYTCLYLKKKTCEFVSLKIYGSPEIVEIGLLQKTKDITEYSKQRSIEIASFVKKSFLSYTYQFIDSSMFTSTLTNVATIIEYGLYSVLSMIPGYGILLVTTLKTSGGLSMILSSIMPILKEAMYYGFTAIMINESGKDIYILLTSVCIKKPDLQHKLSLQGIKNEISNISTNIGDDVKNYKNIFNNFISF
jgi:hypothetical protein